MTMESVLEPAPMLFVKITSMRFVGLPRQKWPSLNGIEIVVPPWESTGPAAPLDVGSFEPKPLKGQ